MLRTGGWVFHSSRSPLKFETVVRRVQRGWGESGFQGLARNLKPAMASFQDKAVKTIRGMSPRMNPERAVYRAAAIVESMPGLKSQMRVARARRAPPISSTTTEEGKKP